MPPSPQSQQQDSSLSGQAAKSMSVNSSLNVVHQFLVFQVYIQHGDPFSLEIHLRDKGNVSQFETFLATVAFPIWKRSW